MRKPLLAAFAASSLLAFGATMAGAQPPAPPPGMDPAAGRADDMTLLLGLRPDQRPALDAFLGAVMPPPRDNEDRRGPPDASAMQARMDAMQRFRAGLTPDQQARLDALERLRHGMGPHMGGHGHWGGGGPE